MTTSNTKVIWFNKGLSSIAQALQLISENLDGCQLICSHTNKFFVGFEYSDIHLVEPRHISANDYIDYALSICDEYGVDVFWPSRFQIQITENIELFESRGVRVITPADADTLRTIEDKAALYNQLIGIVPIPTNFRVSNYRDFWYGYSAIKQQGKQACIKPTSGIFAQGFRVIKEERSLIDVIMKDDEFSIDFHSLNQCLEDYEDKDLAEPFLLMQYLSGAELSCDCVASGGVLKAHVIREKSTIPGVGQIIVDNPQVELVISDIVQKLSLDGPFNIQFKYDDGEPYLLEINSRLSGGIHLAAQSGINIPLLAVDPDNKAPEKVLYGTRVHDLSKAVIFSCQEES